MTASGSAPPAAPPAATTAATTAGTTAGPRLATVVGLVVVVAGLVIGLRPISDNSFLTHLATGRLILEAGIPRADPYTFTAAGEPWVVQSWLASAVYGVVERVVGPSGLVLLTGALAGALAALVWRLSRPCPSVVGRVVLVMPVLAVGSVMWNARPALVAAVLFALVLVALDGGLDPRWLVPVMWVWVNVHGSFALALVVVVATAVGARLDGRPTARERRVLWCVAAGTAAGAVGPLGPRLLAFPVELLGHREVLRNIEEWKPVSFDRAWHWALVVAVGLAGAALARRWSWRGAVPLVVFTAAALASMRNVGLATVVAVAAAAPSLPRIGSLDGAIRLRRGRAAVVALAATALVLAAGAARRPAFDLDGYPVSAVAAAEASGELRPGDRVVAQDFVGNWLVLRWGPEERVFVDDRYDLWSASTLADVTTLVRGGPGWSEVLDRHDADAVVWERDRPLAAALARAPGWRVVVEDTDWLVAVRR